MGSDRTAFSFATTYTAPMPKNGSILGIAYKLELLGLLSDPKATATILVTLFTALLLGVLLLVGLRRPRSHPDALCLGDRSDLLRRGPPSEPATRGFR